VLSGGVVCVDVPGSECGQPVWLCVGTPHRLQALVAACRCDPLSHFLDSRSQ